MEKHDFKVILWDNDGILVETEKWYYEATRQIMEQEGVHLTLDDYRQTFLKENTGAWHLLKNKDELHVRKLRNQRNKLYSSLLKTKHIFMDGISSVLQKLHGKYKMGIVTSSRKEHFDIIHERNNILNYFDFVITSEDFTHSKPNPEPYLIGIEKSGHKAEECIAIEDSERGVMAAKRANLFCIAIPNEMTKNSNFNNADIIMNNINEIHAIL
tara:strand:- start:468 stop:1106 length:639 start_codon:yes stop_codon:yes gene_type:complete